MIEIKNYMKLLKTFNVYLAFFTLGLLLSIVGPSLLDLEHIIHTDTQHISLIYTARSTGYIVGAILGGVILDITQFRQAVLSLCCFVAAGTMLGIPWSRNFGSLFGYMLVNGIFLGAMETGGNVICLNLWGKDSGPIFQGLQFTYGLGGLIAPLIAAPYLGHHEATNPTVADPENYSMNSTADTLLDHSSANSTTMPSYNLTRGALPGITYPFSFVGLFACLTAASLLAVSIKSPTEEQHRDENKQDNSRRSFGFMFMVVVLNFALIFVGCGMEIGYGQMLTTFAAKGNLHLPVTKGSYMTSAFWAAFAASRLAAAFLAIKVRDLFLILGDLALASVAAIMLLTLMPNETVLWVASVIFGVGIASFYASVVGWMNTYVYVTNKIAAIVTVGAAAGEMVAPFVISYFMDSIPDMFSYVIATACLLTGVVVFATYMFLKKFDTEVPEKKPEVYVIRTSSTDVTTDKLSTSELRA